MDYVTQVQQSPVNFFTCFSGLSFLYHEITVALVQAPPEVHINPAKTPTIPYQI